MNVTTLKEDREELMNKKRVWIPHRDKVYVSAYIVESTEDKVTVLTEDGKRKLILPISLVYPINPPKFDLCPDLSQMSYLNEPNILHNLELRYDSDLIYTYSGLFLLAVNPYKQIKDMYSIDMMKAYSNPSSFLEHYPSSLKSENQPLIYETMGIEPHIFKIAYDAFSSMTLTHKNQSILITGESGAGKTENTKKVISFLAHLSYDGVSNKDILDKILETNNVLESFGNAQTIKNNNSSRFGKFIKIEFLNQRIAGAYIVNYLLEKSRVTRVNEGERNYHIFYQLIKSINSNTASRSNSSNTASRSNSSNTATGSNNTNIASRLNSINTATGSNNNIHDNNNIYGNGIEDIEYSNFIEKVRKKCLFEENVNLYDFKFLKGTNPTISEIDDVFDFKKLNKSLGVLEFKEEDKISLFKLISAILHIGNIEVIEKNDQAQVVNIEVVNKVCSLLKISSNTFLSLLMNPVSMAGNDRVILNRTKDQVNQILEALARFLYERLFDSIINKLNTVLAINRKSSEVQINTIGVLDIAGFEIYSHNDFEQLCINYTNEKLQQFFNHHMFILEQETYKKENIEWDFIDFGLDLQPTIDLIEKNNPIGILGYLEEECVMPKGCVTRFLEKLKNIENNKLQNTKKTNDLKVTKGKVGLDQIQNQYNKQRRGRRVTFIDENVIKGLEKEVLNKNVRANKGNNLVDTGSNKGIKDSETREKIFELCRLEQGFSIEHYAGKVKYLVKDWLSKNKDPYFDYLVRLLEGSNDNHVSSLFQVIRSGKKGFFSSVSQNHREGLNLLMLELCQTNPFFVRCILPNTNKKSNQFDTLLVMNQLKCNGVMEGIRISRLGFPTRMTFKEFRKRYGIIKSINNVKDNKDVSILLLKQIEKAINQKRLQKRPIQTNLLQNQSVLVNSGHGQKLSVDSDYGADGHRSNKSYSGHDQKLSVDSDSFANGYRLGTTMIFFKQGLIAEIEELRDEKIRILIEEIKMHLTKKLKVKKSLQQEIRVKSIEILQKNALLSINFRRWNWWRLYMKIKPLLDITKMDIEIKQRDEEINKLNAQIDSERKTVLEYENRIKTLNMKLTEIEREMEKELIVKSEKEDLINLLRLNNDSLKEELEQLKTKVKEKEEQLIKLEKEKNDLSARVLVLENSFKDKEVVNNQLIKKIAGFENILKNKEDVNSSLSEKVNNYEVVLKEKEAVNKKLSEKVCVLEVDLKEKESLIEKSLKEQESFVQDTIKRLEKDKDVLSDKLLSLESLVVDKDEEIKSMSAVNQELSGKLSSLEGELSVKERKVGDINSTNTELLSKLVDLQSSLAVKEDEVGNIQLKNEDLLSKLVDLEGVVVEKESEVKKILSKNEDLLSKVVDLEGVVVEKESEVKKILSKNKDLISKLDSCKTALAEKEVELSSMKSVTEDLSQKLNTFKSSVVEKESVCNIMKSKTSILDKKLHCLEEALTEKDRELQGSLSVNEDLSCKLATLKGVLAEKEGLLHSITTDNQDLTDKLITLGGTLSDKEGLFAELCIQNDAQQDKIKALECVLHANNLLIGELKGELEVYVDGKGVADLIKKDLDILKNENLVLKKENSALVKDAGLKEVKFNGFVKELELLKIENNNLREVAETDLKKKCEEVVLLKEKVTKLLQENSCLHKDLDKNSHVSRDLQERLGALEEELYLNFENKKKELALEGEMRVNSLTNQIIQLNNDLSCIVKEKEFCDSERDRLLSEVKEREDEVFRLNSNLLDMKKEVKVVEERCKESFLSEKNDLSKNIDVLQKQLLDSQCLLSTKTREFRELESDLRTRLDGNSKKIIDLGSQVRDNEMKLREKEGDFVCLEDELKRKREEIEEKDILIRENSVLLREKDDMLHEKGVEIGDLKEKFVDFELKEKEFAGVGGDLKSIIDTLREGMKEKQRLLSEKHGLYLEVQKNLFLLEERCNRYEHEIVRLQSSNAGLGEVNVLLRGERSELHAELSRMRSSRDELEGKLIGLNERIDILEQDLDHYKVLESNREIVMNGIGESEKIGELLKEEEEKNLSLRNENEKLRLKNKEIESENKRILISNVNLGKKLEKYQKYKEEIERVKGIVNSKVISFNKILHENNLNFREEKQNLEKVKFELEMQNIEVLQLNKDLEEEVSRLQSINSENLEKMRQKKLEAESNLKSATLALEKFKEDFSAVCGENSLLKDNCNKLKLDFDIKLKETERNESVVKAKLIEKIDILKGENYNLGIEVNDLRNKIVCEDVYVLLNNKCSLQSCECSEETRVKCKVDLNFKKKFEEIIFNAKKLKEKKKFLEKKNLTNEKEIKSLNFQIQNKLNLENENKVLTNQIVVLENDSRILKEQYFTVKNNKEQLNLEIEKLKNKIKEKEKLNFKLHEFENKFNKINHLNKNLMHENLNFKNSLNQLNLKLHEFEKENENLKNENKKFENENLQKNQKNNSFKLKINQLERELKEERKLLELFKESSIL